MRSPKNLFTVKIVSEKIARFLFVRVNCFPGKFSRFKHATLFHSQASSLALGFASGLESWQTNICLSTEVIVERVDKIRHLASRSFQPRVTLPATFVIIRKWHFPDCFALNLLVKAFNSHKVVTVEKILHCGHVLFIDPEAVFNIESDYLFMFQGIQFKARLKFSSRGLCVWKTSLETSCFEEFDESSRMYITNPSQRRLSLKILDSMFTRREQLLTSRGSTLFVSLTCYDAEQRVLSIESLPSTFKKVYSMGKLNSITSCLQKGLEQSKLDLFT